MPDAAAHVGRESRFKFQFDPLGLAPEHAHRLTEQIVRQFARAPERLFTDGQFFNAADRERAELAARRHPSDQ
jgi:hypothetical protein